MKKIGISFSSGVKRYGIQRALEICAESGFDSIDFNLNEYGSEADTEGVYARSDDDIREYFTRIGERAHALGLIVGQTHGRLRIATPDPAYCALARENARRDLLASAALGAPYCIMHSVSTFWFPNDTAEQMHARNLDFFSSLIPYAEAYGVAMTQETFGDTKRGEQRVLEFYGDSRELLRTHRALDTKCKALCLDSGHTNSSVCVAKQTMGFPVPGPAETVRLFGSELKALHLNDNNGFTDQHLPPRAIAAVEAVDWAAVLDALDEIGFDGVYNFETNIGAFGTFLEEAMHFYGKYMRALVDRKLC